MDRSVWMQASIDPWLDHSFFLDIDFAENKWKPGLLFRLSRTSLACHVCDVVGVAPGHVFDHVLCKGALSSGGV